MKLLQLHKGKFRVLLVGNSDACQVLDFLDRYDERQAIKMLSLLEYVSVHGLPVNENKAKHLKGSVWEFKVGPKKGAKLRVAFFRDSNNTFICTEAFTKRSRTPQTIISKCEDAKTKYISDSKNGKIVIEKLPDEDEVEDEE